MSLNHLMQLHSRRFLADDDHGHDDHGDEHSEEDGVLTMKIVVIFLVAIFALVVFLPYMQCIKNRKVKQKVDDGSYNNMKFVCCGGGRIQSYSTAFASGMLMTMALCHILPETITSYENVMKSSHSEEGHDHRLLAADDHGVEEEGDHGGKFPTAYVFFLVGFWIM